MKRTLGVVAVLFLVLSGAWFGFRWYYLQPKKILETLVPRLEAALGFPIHFDSMTLAGMNNIAVERARVADPFLEGKDLFFAGSANLRWKLSGALAGSLGLGTFEARLADVTATLRKDAIHGWNFRAPQLSAAPRGEEGKSGRGMSWPKWGRPSLTVWARAERAQLMIDHPEWGLWGIRWPGTQSLEYQRTRGEEQVLTLYGRAEVQAGQLPAQIPTDSPLMDHILRTFDPAGSKLTQDLEFKWNQQEWEFQSRGEPGVQWESPRFKLEMDRFRASGQTRTGNLALVSAAFDRGHLHLASWDNPVIQNLRLPWVHHPEGPLEVEVKDCRYAAGKLGLHLSGMHIEAVTLAARELPWLRILSRRELWALDGVALETAVSYQQASDRYEWSQGKIAFSGGDGGVIETNGFVQGGPDLQWQITTGIQRFPLPTQDLEGHTLDPGFLSGEMTWGEAKSPSGVFHLLGKGRVVLQGGEMGAVRLLGKIDQMLNVEEIAHARFDSLTFEFSHSEDELTISNLNLSSDLLRLEGQGSYRSGGTVDVLVTAKASPALLEAVKPKRASTILQSLLSVEKLSIRITGDLDSPSYQITPSEGVTIPIEEILQNATKN